LEINPGEIVPQQQVTGDPKQYKHLYLGVCVCMGEPACCPLAEEQEGIYSTDDEAG
jgi:hypothetical protein